MTTVLHMDTDAVRATARQLAQAANDIRNQIQALNGNVQGMGWQGGGREQFVADFEALTGNANNTTEQCVRFGQRLLAEADQWEGIAADSGPPLTGITISPYSSKEPPLSAWAHVTEVPPLIYGRFSQLAYSDSPQASDDLKSQGWEFYGDVNKFLPNEKLDGYFGAVFINRRTGEVVIAHRGTEQWNLNPFNGQSSDLDDDAALALGQIPDQYAVSRKLTEQVKSQLAQDPGMAGYSLVHTGHSLGAALADLNALTDNSKGITFDNPGTLAIVKNNSNVFTGARTQLVNYQSNPNLVHLGGTPAGYTVQIVPKQGGTNMNRAAEAVMRNAVSPIGLYATFKSTEQHHNLDNILNSMNPDTGYPKGYFPPAAGDVDKGWHNLNEKNVAGAAYAPACYAPPPL